MKANGKPHGGPCDTAADSLAPPATHAIHQNVPVVICKCMPDLDWPTMMHSLMRKQMPELQQIACVRTCSSCPRSECKRTHRHLHQRIGSQSTRWSVPNVLGFQMKMHCGFTKGVSTSFSRSFRKKVRTKQMMEVRVTWRGWIFVEPIRQVSPLHSQAICQKRRTYRKQRRIACEVTDRRRGSSTSNGSGYRRSW